MQLTSTAANPAEPSGAKWTQVELTMACQEQANKNNVTWWNEAKLNRRCQNMSE